VPAFQTKCKQLVLDKETGHGMANDLKCEKKEAALSMLAGGAAIPAIEHIAQLHSCDSTHSESVPVQEVFTGHPARNGVLEVFDLIGHPKAKRSHGRTYGGVSYQIGKARGRLIADSQIRALPRVPLAAAWPHLTAASH